MSDTALPPSSPENSPADEAREFPTVPPPLDASLEAAIRRAEPALKTAPATEQQTFSQNVQPTAHRNVQENPLGDAIMWESPTSGEEASRPAKDQLTPEKPLGDTPWETPSKERKEKDAKEEAEEEEEEGDDATAPGSMSLRDHLKELRRRLLRVFLIALLGFFAAYPFGKEIYDLLLIPLLKVLPASSSLIYTSVPEAFFTYMKVAFIAGLFVTSPLIFYQFWAFVAPGLYKEEQAVILPFALVSAVSFLCGGAFCFFIVFPLAFEFFMSFTTDTIQAMPTLHEYLSFVLHLLVPFGLVFEMPLVTFVLARLGLISADRLRRTRRYAIVVIFILAAVFTPPDVFSQILMAVPMLILYEVSILIAAFCSRPTAPTDDDKEKIP